MWGQPRWLKVVGSCSTTHINNFGFSKEAETRIQLSYAMHT